MVVIYETSPIGYERVENVEVVAESMEGAIDEVKTEARKRDYFAKPVRVELYGRYPFPLKVIQMAFFDGADQWAAKQREQVQSA